MKKSISSIIITLFIAGYGFAQTFSPEVIPIQAGMDQTDHMILEWTLGETFVETLLHDSNMFTQGFHQPILKVEIQQQYIKTESSSELDITIAPNPVQGVLNINIKSTEDNRMEINLYDINGKLNRSASVFAKQNSVAFDVSDLPPSIYLLQITDKNGSTVETYKIIKN
jgi:hypothetical protein